MSFRKCVMSPAHNTPTLPISCLEGLASESSEVCQRVWKVVGPSKLKTACSAADGFGQVYPLV
jgi:hypothetical protein